VRPINSNTPHCGLLKPGACHTQGLAVATRLWTASQFVYQRIEIRRHSARSRLIPVHCTDRHSL
jgi:hypothetical protein